MHRLLQIFSDNTQRWGGGSSTMYDLSSLTGLDRVALVLHENNNIFSCLVESNPVKTEISLNSDTTTLQQSVP